MLHILVDSFTVLIHVSPFVQPFYYGAGLNISNFAVAVADDQVSM
jgi:hypothetical protein